MPNKKTTTVKNTLRVILSGGSRIRKIRTNNHQYKIYAEKIINKNGTIHFKRVIIPKKIFKQIVKQKLIKKNHINSNYLKTIYTITNKGMKLILKLPKQITWANSIRGKLYYDNMSFDINTIPNTTSNI